MERTRTVQGLMTPEREISTHIPLKLGVDLIVAYANPVVAFVPCETTNLENY